MFGSAKMKRAVAMMLTAVVALTNLPITPVQASNESVPKTARSPVVSESGISFDLTWDENNKYAEGDSFNYVTDSSTTTNATMKVSYSSKKVREEGYKAGELVITVDGISSAYRSGTPSYAIGADKASDTVKTRDWSYTYNKKNDVFTFTNNRDIQPNSVFSGYFELVFSMDARSCKDLYEKDITATFMIPDESEVKTEPIHFFVDTSVDTYTVDIEVEELYSTHGFSIENPQDYFWRKYPLDANRVNHSRGVKGGERYVVTIPEGAVLYSPYLSAKQLSSTEYQIGLGTNSYSKDDMVFVLYPKDQFEDTDVTVSLEGFGTYYEGLDGVGVEEEVSLARDEVTTHLPLATDFDFRLPTGVHRVYKDDPYPYTSSYGADIFGETMVTGTTQTWSMSGNIVSYGADNPTSLQIIDDFQYITLVDGTWRQLTSADYQNKSVTIPSNKDIINVNNLPLTPDKYEVQVYAVQNDETIREDDSTLVYSGLIDASSHKVDLPEGTTAVSIRINGLEEIVNSFKFSMDTEYHVDNSAENVNLTSGRVKNTLVMRYYDGEGNWLDEAEATEDKYVDNTNLNLAQKDLDVYGHYQLRDDAEITFYGRDAFKSNYSAYTALNTFQPEERKFMSTFTIGGNFSMDNEERFDKFSLYTILPDGLKISGNANSVEQLWDVLSLSGLGLDAETLANHATLELVQNYKDSGQTYVAIHFDLTDVEGVNFNSGVRASMGVSVDMNWYKKNGGSFQVKSVCMIDDDTPYKEQSKRADDGSYANDIWSDIDNDGNTEELLAYNSDYKSILYADSSQFEMNKWIESQYTDGMVQLPDVADVGYGDEYTYTTRIINGANKSKDIVIYDNLENGENSEWHGTFKGVDTSDAESLGLTPTVYYSENRNAGDLDSGDWTTSLDASKVQSIAIKLDGELGSGKIMDIKITMTAPSDKTLKNKITENNYGVEFTMVDLASDSETKVDYLDSNFVQGRLVAGYKDITVTKEDEVNGAKLSGAEFQLVNKETQEVVGTATSNAKGYANFKRVLQDETYILKETKAPQGYEKAKDVEVTVDMENVKITVEDPRIKGTIEINKQNALDNTLKVKGAEYSVTNSKGVVVGKIVTDENGYGKLEGLDWDKYVVKETKSPQGYELDENEYEVTINRENVAEVQVVGINEAQVPTSVTLKKYEADINGEHLDSELSGAVFDLYKKIGEEYKIQGTYVTDMNGEIYVDELAFGNYQFREKRAPEGYKLDSTPIDFKITEKQTDVTYKAYNTRKAGTIRLFKLDENGIPVAGGVYALMNADKEVIDEYTTNQDGYVYIENLEWGTYYIKETKAPNGYKLDETEYEVVVDAKHIAIDVKSVDETKKGSVVLTKYDEIGKNALEGAVFSLYKNDGTVVKEGLTTDTDGKVQVDGLEWGSYYFKETKAPQGYGLSDEVVRFSVNAMTANAIQELSMKDPLDSRVITVTKRIKAEDINFSNGNPSFVFCMTGTDIDSEEHEYNRIVTFTEDYVANNTGEDGYVSQTVTFSGFKAGNYEVHEEETSRYEFESITNVENGTIDGQAVDFDMVNNEDGCCTYTNRNYEAQYFSHTSGVSNVLKEQAVMTSITVIWNGEDTLDSGTVINRDDIDVYANYDDGSSLKVANDLYDLSIEEVPFVHGDYTVEVTYTDAKGTICKGDFTFNVNYVIKPIDIEVVVPEDVYPGGFHICKDCFEYNLVFNDGSKAGIDSEDITLLFDKVNEAKTYKLPNESSTTVSVSAFITIDKYEQSDVVGTSFDVKLDVPVVKTIYDKRLVSRTNGIDVFMTGVFVTESYDALIFGHEGIPEGNVDDGGTTFDEYYSIVKTVYFSKSVGEIKSLERWFKNCSSLETVYSLPSCVSDLDQAFNGCTSLVSVSEIPASVTDMVSTFRGCTSLVTAPEIPDSVTNMYCTFYRCISLVNAPEIPASVTDMCYTFRDCTSLVNAPEIPDGVTNMDSTFRGCTSLVNAPEIPASVTDMSYTFYGCTSLVEAPKIPDGVTGMESTFKGCTSLVGAPVIPEGVTDMESTFYGCTSLVDAPAIPEGVTNMRYTFCNCILLADAPAIPEGVTDMSYTFYGCASLVDAPIIPEGVTSMRYTFCRCTSLVDAPAIPEGVTNMEATFHSCTSLVNAPAIPEGVTDMAYTFYGCTKIVTAPEIPDSVMDILNTFYGCASLVDAPIIPEGVTSMAYTFYGCASLVDAPIIPEGVTSMAYTFRDCRLLVNAPVIPEGVTDMSYTFYGCASLVDAPIIPEGVTSMAYTFSGCTSLMNAPVLPDSVTNMSGTFSSCSSLVNAPVIPEGVTTMTYTFRGCYDLDGEIEVNAQSLTNYLNCFYKAGRYSSGVVLTGTSPYLEELAATGSYVTIKDAA